jgi:hypothetical protein
MKIHKEVNALISQAEAERRCCYGSSDAQRRALHRRVLSNELASPYPNMYARSGYWEGLNPEERTCHLVVGLSQLHPRWVFAGLSAAAALGFDHPWALHDDRYGLVHIATSGPTRRESRLQYFHVHDLKVRAYAGLRVTTPAQTLVTCAIAYPFIYVLPIFDSALRKRMTTKLEILEICDAMHIDVGSVLRLLHYANALSENGGESLCRAIIIEYGFAIPLLQETLVDPYGGGCYRVDFLWRLADGRVIVLEFDGAAKYADPQMTRGRGVERVVFEERRREDALRRAGVTTIIRVNYSEVAQGLDLVRKLQNAGIPRITQRAW